MRYERKFSSPWLSFSALEQLIIGHPMAFRKTFPKRQINNIYFDTLSWSTFYENTAGISRRTKYRLRWYGVIGGRIKGAQFELKKKENLLGSKKIFPIPGEISWEYIPSLIRDIPSIQQNGLIPVLLNSYERTYYESADRHFRLTLDQNLRCAPYVGGNSKVRFLPERILIVELKYDQNQESRLDEFTQYWPLRIGRCSKYVMGMQMAYH